MITTSQKSVAVFGFSALYFIFGPRKLYFQLCHDLKLLSIVPVSETLYIEAISDRFYQAIFYQLNTYQLVNNCQPNSLVSSVSSFYKEISLSNKSLVGNQGLYNSLGLESWFEYKAYNFFTPAVILGCCVLVVILYYCYSSQINVASYYSNIKNIFFENGFLETNDNSNDNSNNNRKNNINFNKGENVNSSNRIGLNKRRHPSDFTRTTPRKHLPIPKRGQPSKEAQDAKSIKATSEAYEESANNLNHAKDDFRKILTTYQGMVNHLTKNYSFKENEALNRDGRTSSTIVEQFIASQNKLIDEIQRVRTTKEENAKTLQILLQRLKKETEERGATFQTGSSDNDSPVLPTDISVSENGHPSAGPPQPPSPNDDSSKDTFPDSQSGPPVPPKDYIITGKSSTNASATKSASVVAFRDDGPPSLKDDLPSQASNPVSLAPLVPPKNYKSTGNASANIPAASTASKSNSPGYNSTSSSYYSASYRDPGGPSKPPVYPIRPPALDSDSEYSYSEYEEPYEGKGKGKATAPQWIKRKKFRPTNQIPLATLNNNQGIRFHLTS